VYNTVEVLLLFIKVLGALLLTSYCGKHLVLCCNTFNT